MKFTTDAFDERVLDVKDTDGDRLRITICDGNETNAVVQVNYEAIYLNRKQLRKLAKRILKETAK